MTSNLRKYEILNLVTPYFNATLYPYNILTDDKIIETRKEITLIYQHRDAFFITKDRGKRRPGGDDQKITIFLYDVY